jgi:hypothetical protein
VGLYPLGAGGNSLSQDPQSLPETDCEHGFLDLSKALRVQREETVFDFEVLGDAEGRVKKIAVMAYIAPARSRGPARTFRAGRFPPTGISIVPAFQTLYAPAALKLTERPSPLHRKGLVAHRHFRRPNLVLSRGIKAGIRTMVEALQREIEQNWFELSLAKSPTSDQNRIRAIKMRLKQELEIAQNLFFSPIYGTVSDEAGDKQLAVKEERIFQMILPALERLVRQMERTIRHFTLNFNNARVAKVYVSAAPAPSRILDYIGDELGLPIEVLNPFTHAEGFRAILRRPNRAQASSTHRPWVWPWPAIPRRTFFTYKARARPQHRRINRGLFACFFALILACVGLPLAGAADQGKDLQKLNLQNQLANFDVRVDKTSSSAGGSNPSRNQSLQAW